MTFMTFFYDIWDSILFRKVLEFLLLHKKHTKRLLLGMTIFSFLSVVL
jgi:hypothetical protein